VSTGRGCILVSQVGVSGSTRLGNYVVMGGQVGVAGHLEIGDQVTFLAKSGVTKSIHEPGAYTGYPARPLIEGRRMMMYPGRVPELMDRVKDLEKKLAELDASPEPDQFQKRKVWLSQPATAAMTTKSMAACITSAADLRRSSSAWC